ncbi:NAD-dependent succinate-semialdehyde dehydrogenase [Fodinicurvata sp. EGI_FJ10296]|uniref:NAD-dependent succinate-semialdehyde dehydrogenase n=1 Tax=Fodinicurvata sp. EGI_FJ10296 TaxID=3231908 RepID=UPI0034554609
MTETALKSVQTPQNGVFARLSRPDLFETRVLIDGEFCQQDGSAGMTVRNPADETVLGQVPNLGAADTKRAIDAAKRAYPGWRRLLAKERSAILRRWGDLMLANKEDLATIMTFEQGKPLAESRGEIDYAAGFFHWFAEEAVRADGDTLQPFRDGQRLLVFREPVGVTAAITPWNFPSAMITRKAGAALAAGCPMIVRPASETPFSATALAVLAVEAGVPAGVFQVVTGDGRTIAGALCESDVVRKISFTGSTEVGRILLRQSAETVKKVSMELGGHAPFIAFDDVELERAVAGAIGAKFQTTGQDCLAANRLYIQESLYDRFAAKFAAAADNLSVGNGFDDGVRLGPLMDEQAVEKCEQHVADALGKGATLLAGGRRLTELGKRFYAPTVLGDVTDDMAITREETFGPVAPIMKFRTEDDVIERANATAFGLAAYVFTRDMSRMFRLGEALEYGMVGINAVSMTGPSIPFGGHKQSGLGREGSKYGLDDYTELKYLCIGVDA